jgi:integrase
MPRRKQPARLYLRKKRSDRQAVWVILDGTNEIGTGAGANDVAAAQQALRTYLAEQHRPPSGSVRPNELLVDEIVAVYLRDHAPKSPSKEWIGHTAAGILEWWTGKTLLAVNGPNCRAYVQWRTGQRIKSFTKKPGRLVSDQTARHELKTLRAAINFYHKEYGPLQSVPAVTMPAKAAQRDGYYWTRQEAAARIRAARAKPETRHLARLILIGLYSGPRPGAILRLKWLPSPHGGWIDVENSILHRRGMEAIRSKKRQPPTRLHARLLHHVGSWRAADLAKGIVSVIHYHGVPVKKVRRSWQTVREDAGHSRHDGPHILRHSSATWFMQAGVDVAEVAGYLGMTPEVLWETYGHHHPRFQEHVAQTTPKKRANRTGTQQAG